MLKQRILTACVLVLLLLVILFVLPYKGFAYAMTLVFTVAAWEWANMAGIQVPLQRIMYALLHAACCLGLIALGIQPSAIFSMWLLLAIAIWFVALFAVARYPEHKLWQKPLVMKFAGIWLLLPAFSSLLVLQPLVPNSGLILLVIGSIAAADIGAYFSGRQFGRRKLAVYVSPGKTWEGFWGGVIACILLASGVAFHQEFPVMKSVLFVLLMVLTAMASVLGDLFESMIKRERGIKDSSSLLPGHGGVLDRIDGWTAALPVFTLIYLFSR